MSNNYEIKRILYILNVANKVNNFSYSSMMAAKKIGYEFHIAGNWSYKSADELVADEKKYGIKIHQVDFKRFPFHPKNIEAYKQIAKILTQFNFECVHCNTPIGGVIGRLASKRYGIKSVIYEAHGFHFFKKSSLISWILYYPIEKILARLCDCLITINNEDFNLAKHKFTLRKGGTIKYLPGVGIDLSIYSKSENLREKVRHEFNVKTDDVLVISTGDLIKRKNYELAIEVISKCNNSNIKFFICGEGKNRNKLEKLIERKRLNNKVYLLGNRSDIVDLLNAADIFLFTTKQEGLSRSLMEAMAMELPCIVSKIRGNVDLIKDKNCVCNSIDDYCNAIKYISDINNRSRVVKQNCETIKGFDVNRVIDLTKELYKEVISNHDK